MKLTEKEDYELQREEGKMTSKAYETGIRKKTSTRRQGLLRKACS